MKKNVHHVVPNTDQESKYSSGNQQNTSGGSVNTFVHVSLATSKWNQELSNGEAQQKRCSHARFCHLGSSAVGGSARLNLAPGSGRCLSPPLPPVSGRPSNEHCFIVFQERWTGLMRAHLLAGLCDLRPTLWSRHLWSSRTSKHKFSP